MVFEKIYKGHGARVTIDLKRGFSISISTDGKSWTEIPVTHDCLKLLYFAVTDCLNYIDEAQKEKEKEGNAQQQQNNNPPNQGG